MKTGTIFGYACTPSCGFFGKSDGGFSVDITCDGELIYKTYKFDHVEVAKKSYPISQDAVGKIQHIFGGAEALVVSLNPRLDNGSCDGCCNRFVFNGKEIISWNISKSDIEELKKRNPSYYREFKENVEQENSVLELFDLITPILKDYGFTLTLYEFETDN